MSALSTWTVVYFEDGKGKQKIVLARSAIHAYDVFRAQRARSAHVLNKPYLATNYRLLRAEPVTA